MRIINVKLIENLVAELCIKSNTKLREDVFFGLVNAAKKEKNKLTKKMLDILVQNAKIAASDSLPICQDTGIAVVFLEVGQDIHFKGGLLKDAVNEGVKKGYRDGFLRKSVVKDPIFRVNTKTNTPTVIHFDLVKGSRLKITVFPKGFGSENKSVVSMFLPTTSIEEIEDFIVGAVKNAGPDACPPYIIGVGMGGTLDKAVYLSKKALLSDLRLRNPKKHLDLMEKRILKKINRLNIGVMGIGGRVTALGVRILDFPTHIAGLPVAVNISCHALRSASKVL